MAELRLADLPAPVRWLLGAFSGVILVLVLFVFPFFGITRTFPLVSRSWQELSVLSVCLAATVVALGRVFSAPSDLRKILLRDNLQCSSEFTAEHVAGMRTSKLTIFAERHGWILGLLFVFLYCASTALCIRLRILGFDGECPTVQQAVRTLGLVLVLFGAALPLKAVIAAFSQPAAVHEVTRFMSVFKLRHPILLGWMIFLAGLPLSFGIWMPDIALPGIYIALKWFVRRQETSLKQQFGAEYEKFQTATHCLFPFGTHC